MKLRNVFLRLISSALVMALLLCSSNVEVLARGSEDVVELEFTITEIPGNPGMSRLGHDFDIANISVGRVAEGMDVDILCVVSEDAAVVGIKDIKIKHKVGIFWSEVASASGGELKDTDGIGFHSVYNGAVLGDTYKITCVYYADFYDGTHREMNGDSGAFTYNFPLPSSNAYTVTF